MDETGRRSRGLKVFGIIAAVAGVLLVILAVWINSVAARRTAAMEAKVQDLAREVASRDVSRPPRGELLKGNSWEDFEKAFASLKADKDGTAALSAYVTRDAKADPAKAAAAVAAHAADLDLLRQGVRRENGVYPDLRWEDGFSAKFPSLLASQQLANLAAARARMLHEEGKSAEAAALLLDVCAFARDAGYNTVLIAHMISLAVYGIAFEGLAEIVASGKLGPEQLLEIDRSLEEVERRMPKMAHSLVNEALGMGYGLRQGLSLVSGDSPAMTLMSWRYGFSERIMIAEAFDEALAALRRSAEVESKGWPEAQALSGEIGKTLTASKNPIVQIMVPGLLASEQTSRQRHAQLRLLRAVARWRAGGEVPSQADPFGGKILHVEKDGKLKVWSVNKDGADDGGTGRFRPQNEKDIVLEASR